MKNRNIPNGYDTNKNIRIFIKIIAILFFVYILRLAYLQILDANSYKIKAEKSILKKELVNQDRGLIYDRNMKPLAANLQFNTAYISEAITKNEREKLLAEQKTIDKSDRSKIELLEKYETMTSMPEYSLDEVEKIAGILEIDKTVILSKLEKGISGPIAYKVSDEKKKAIKDLKLGYINFYNESERYYTGKELLASTLGFVENSKGLYGLEKEYDDILSGKSGYAEFYKARGGTILPFESSKNIEGEKAKNIVTTIDEDFQKILYKNLIEVFKKQKPLYATAILSNPNNGDILAMESLPSFDANNPRALDGELDQMFLEKLKDDDIDKYRVSRWNNLNVSSVYEPGSTFKGITTAIAIDSNRHIEEDNHYFCSGSVEIAPGVRINCWRPHNPHGRQNLMEAFSNSCNPAFVGIIDDIGKENFYQYGLSLGLGQNTGVDLPNEVSGVFPRSADIKNVDFRPMSYGHSLSVTPLQELMILNATVNGGSLYRPKLVKSILDSDNKLVKKIEANELGKVFSEKTSATMRLFYENNSKNSYSLKNNTLRIGHKTGTTTVRTSDNVFDEDKSDYIGMTIMSIYGMYPSDAPKYSLVIVVSNPLIDALGSSLGPSVDAIFSEIDQVELKRQAADISDKELLKIPEVIDLPIYEAKELLRKQGLNIYYDEEKISEYQIITGQNPIGDGYIEHGGQIEVYVETNGKIEIMDFVQMDKIRAEEALKKNGYNYKIIGDGETIKSQKPAAGQLINKTDKIELFTNDN